MARIMFVLSHDPKKRVHIILASFATFASVKKCTYGVGCGNLQLQHFCDICAWEYLDNCHKY